jgi:hypothetical protein
MCVQGLVSVQGYGVCAGGCGYFCRGCDVCAGSGVCAGACFVFEGVLIFGKGVIDNLVGFTSFLEGDKSESSG